MKELGEAINNSLSDSEQIAEVITRIKTRGYDVFLVLEATIGFNEREGETPDATLDEFDRDDFQMTTQDVKFLKSLRIKVDGDS